MRVLCQQNECPICRRINQKVKTKLLLYAMKKTYSYKIPATGHFHIGNLTIS